MRLQEGETVLHELRPEAQVVAIWFFTKAVPSTFVGAFLTFWSFAFFATTFATSAGSNSNWPFVAAGIATVIITPVLLILGVIYCNHLRRTHVYYVTSRRCIFKGGILRRVVRSVPYHKITDVEMSQHIIERILGISRLRIFTPGESMMASPFGWERAEITFIGLKDNETPATTISEILSKFRATGE